MANLKEITISLDDQTNDIVDFTLLESNFKEVVIDSNKETNDIVDFTLLESNFKEVVIDSNKETNDTVDFTVLENQKLFSESNDGFGSLFGNDLLEALVGPNFIDYSNNDNIFTSAYNTVVDLISPLMEYAYDFFWGSK